MSGCSSCTGPDNRWIYDECDNRCCVLLAFVRSTVFHEPGIIKMYRLESLTVNLSVALIGNIYLLQSHDRHGDIAQTFNTGMTLAAAGNDVCDSSSRTGPDCETIRVWGSLLFPPCLCVSPCIPRARCLDPPVGTVDHECIHSFNRHLQAAIILGHSL